MHNLSTYPLKLFYLTKNTLLPHAKRNSAGTSIQVGQIKRQIPLKKGDAKGNTEMIPRPPALPCLWARALCLCNKNWSDFPAISAL